MSQPNVPEYDLDELEAKALPCVHGDPWYTAEQVSDWIKLPKDRAFVAALSPAVALDLIRRVRAAEEKTGRALSLAEEVVANAKKLERLLDAAMAREKELLERFMR